MNTETIIVAIVGVITSALSSWFSWGLSKKKYNSEVKASELDNLKKSLEFYESIVNDNNKKLTFYIKLAEDNRVEVYRLKGTIFNILNSACLDKGCSERQFYTEEEIKNIIGETYVGDQSQTNEQV